jgi:hypothetical protein
MQNLSKSFLFLAFFIPISVSPILDTLAFNLSPFKSQAFDLEENRLQYTEIFIPETRTEDNQSANAKSYYLDFSGNIVAKKYFSFLTAFGKPNYSFRDDIDGYSAGVESQGDKYRIYIKPSDEAPVEEKILKIPDPVVVDLGIHFYILKNWADLISGKQLVFNYIVPRRLDFFKLQIQKSIEIRDGKSRFISFQIQPNNFFLFAVNKLASIGKSQLKYNYTTRELLEYEGVSLIRNENGKSYKVKSYYSYPPQSKLKLALP